ncbi:DUF1330 domain-containing protein [Nocardioides marmorisolisilvae]|uniref:DUF1330 domain-containing protein n=1 Tax=Nocardioides marmorisolisilvae TaxID=1542737 RepID=A0A3N0E0M5_9ACTN|nr:DUF1330 domain-containing protein [Nocardioides marmorisolisilvae]RNL81326.1 DUF1330 domain-containing protein [Nocardioides marmorisolisilvae]
MSTHIDPTEEQVHAFAARAAEKDGPVHMLNLLAFVDDGELYLEYGVAVGAHLERVGASIVYAGNVDGLLIGGADEWDAVAVVRYPSRAAFLEMVTDPGYQEIAPLRTRALRDSRLIPTDSMDGF